MKTVAVEYPRLYENILAPKEQGPPHLSSAEDDFQMARKSSFAVVVVKFQIQTPYFRSLNALIQPGCSHHLMPSEFNSFNQGNDGIVQVAD